MNDRINKTSICSIVFLDIIDYTKTPVSEQIEVKNQFNDFINHALKDVAQNDRIIIDTGDGAAIAYMGSPEDALFMALSIRDGILKSNALNLKTMLVRIGINLGPVRVVKDINGQPNIIGDGINVAQRIMSFARPNQILVSRSYYEVTSRLTQEMSKMFDYSGMKQDKHVREHEVYSVKLDNDQMATGTGHDASTAYDDFSNQTKPASKLNWKYAASGLAIVAALFALTQMLSAPAAPELNISSPPVATALDKTLSEDRPAAPEIAPEQIAADEQLAQKKLAQEARAKERQADNKLAEDKLAAARLTKQKSSQKAKPSEKPAIKRKAKTESSVAQETARASSHTDIAQTPTAAAHSSKPAAEKASEKTESSITQPVLQHVCTQAEKMMNTCH
jgi:class 3 adenylate cyclase